MLLVKNNTLLCGNINSALHQAVLLNAFLHNTSCRGFIPIQVANITRTSCHEFPVVPSERFKRSIFFFLYQLYERLYLMAAFTVSQTKWMYLFGLFNHDFVKAYDRERDTQRQRKKLRRKKVKESERAWERERENMNPSHMKCNLIHFTVVLIEGGTVWSPHKGKNLYTVLCSCECSQRVMLKGKLTVCLDCVPLQQMIWTVWVIL